MFIKTRQLNVYLKRFVLLSVILLHTACSSEGDSDASQANLEGIWRAYWYDDVTTVDHLVIDESTVSGNIKGRWYDANDDAYYDAAGTIAADDINISVQYPFSWSMQATLSADNEIVSGDVTISGSNTMYDGTHPLTLEKVN